MWGKDGSINRRGFYALGYWFAIPSRLAVVAKLERYEADTAVSDSEMIYTVGGAYYITPKTRIMLNYALLVMKRVFLSMNFGRCLK